MHYGIASGAYFELHERVDVKHAADARELISQRLADVDQDALVATAALVLSANWRLLDGVEAAGRPR